MGKTVSESRTQAVHIIMNQDINGAKRLFGGRLMEWIDVVAAVAARRHSGQLVTTACIGNLSFKAPALKNDTLVLDAVLTYVGRTSMEVRVDSYVEELNGTHTMINRAYLVMVAVDENGHPVPVPELILTTEEEKEEWNAAKLRAEHRTLC